MLCVEVAGDGAIVAVEPQPQLVGECLLVVASPTEISSPLNQLFSLTAAEGAQISVAVALVWVVGWAVREARLLGSRSHD